VDQAPISIRQFVERRTALLISLADALSAASASVVGFDLDGLEARITDQQQLSAEVARLDSQMNEIHSRFAVSPYAQSTALPGFVEAIARLREAQTRVSRLNQSHQLLLERSRRTASALLRSYQTFIADTYENPVRREIVRGPG
jgi:hypothetical protein